MIEWLKLLLYMLTKFPYVCREIWGLVCINPIHYICCSILCHVWSCWWAFCMISPLSLFLSLSLSLVWSFVHCCFQLRWGCRFYNSQTWTRWGTSSLWASPSSLGCPFPSTSGNTPVLLYIVLLIPRLDGWVNNKTKVIIWNHGCFRCESINLLFCS